MRKDNVDEALERNPILVTALNPIIGYEKAAAIAKRAYKENRAVFDVALEDSGLSRSGPEETAGSRGAHARRHPWPARASGRLSASTAI